MSKEAGTDMINVDELKRCFAHYPSGVVAVTAVVDDEPHVFVASSFAVGISLEPALVSLAIRKGSSTWAEISKAEVLGVNILGEGQSGVCIQLAGKDKFRRFEGVDRELTEAGSIRLTGAAAFMEGKIWSVVDAGDHDLVLLELHNVTTNHKTEPLVYHSTLFRKLEQLQPA